MKRDELRAKLVLFYEKDDYEWATLPKRFAPTAPLSEDQLAAFESGNRLQLPEAYRAYLRYLGNGARPYHGLAALDPAQYDPLLRLEPTFVEAAGLERNWLQQPDALRGTLSLGTMGGTGEMRLVLSGRERGRVVYVDHDSDAGPHFPPAPDFLVWFEAWLDAALAGDDTTWFGFAPAFGEHGLLRILVDTSEPISHRQRAGAALCRRRRATHETRQAVLKLIADDNPTIQRLACELAASFRLGEAENRLIELAQSDDAAVRAAALGALATRDPKLHQARLREALTQDDDEHVRQQCYQALKQHALIDAADQRLAIRYGPVGAKIDALYRLKNVSAADEPLLREQIRESAHWAGRTMGNPTASRDRCGRRQATTHRAPTSKRRPFPLRAHGNGHLQRTKAPAVFRPAHQKTTHSDEWLALEGGQNPLCIWRRTSRQPGPPHASNCPPPQGWSEWQIHPRHSSSARAKPSPKAHSPKLRKASRAPHSPKQSRKSQAQARLDSSSPFQAHFEARAGRRTECLTAPAFDYNFSLHSGLAQLVEQSAVNRLVVGSSPTSGAKMSPGRTRRPNV